MNLSTTEATKHTIVDGMVLADERTMRLIQLVMLIILDDILDYCEEQGIVCALGGGSTLGAVRHGGFIPWDDDIDLVMPRTDYDRFLAGFPERYAHKYSVQSPELTPEQNGVPMARVRLNGTIMRMHDDAEGIPCGIYIDVTPVENCFDNPVARKLHGVACMGMGLLYSCRRYYRDRAFYLDFSKGDKDFHRAARSKILIGRLLSPLPMRAWSRLVTRVYSLCKNERSRDVVIPAGRGHFFGEIYPREGFLATRAAQFEGRTVRIPRDAEAYLAHLYGDWQAIPPEEEREHHAYLQLDLGSHADDAVEETA